MQKKNIKRYFINFFATKNNSLRSNNVEIFYNFSQKKILKNFLNDTLFFSTQLGLVYPKTRKTNYT